MKKSFIIYFTFMLIIPASAQLRIDASFPFQTDPGKKYSLYIPGNYNPSVPHRLMLALHPFNTARWDGKSWCDTLKVFAEANGLLLVSPDGGVDGKIDDPIDTAFTTALLDSVRKWYNIDPMKVYVMGFSWGGMTAYTYGLYHYQKFAGFIPVGAAVNGTSEVTGIIQHSSGKPFYLVHGSLDSPSIRYYPIRTALISNSAIVNSILMSGVGHTIDFANRNQILSTAFAWIDSVNCSQATNVQNHFSSADDFSIVPNIIGNTDHFHVALGKSIQEPFAISIIDISGKLLLKQQMKANANRVEFNAQELGMKRDIYIISIETEHKIFTQKLIVE